MGHPFLANAPVKVASTWYSEKGRVIATTITMISIQLGVAVGFLIPVFFISEDDTDPEY